MSDLVDRVEELADFFTEQVEEADDLGRLPDRTAKTLRELGIVRALQPIISPVGERPLCLG